jgi:hypothetical protein
VRRHLEALRQKVARLNTKAGKAILFANLAKRWLDIVSGMVTRGQPIPQRLFNSP